MFRSLLVALSIMVVLAAGIPRALGQCPVTQWGEVGGGAVAGQAYAGTFGVAGMGSKLQSISVPTTGGASLFASFDIGKEIKKIRAIGASTAWATDGSSIWAFDRLNAATNPLHLLSVLPLSGGVKDMLAAGFTIYAWNNTTLRVIDYTNGAAPIIVTSVAIPAGVTEAAFLNNRLYMLTGNSVAIFDTSLAVPTLTNTVSLGNSNTVVAAPYAFSGGGSLVHLAFYSLDFSTGTRMLRVVDLNNDVPTGASGGVAITGSIVQIVGNFLIQTQSLASINWTNPLAPVVTTIFSDPVSRFKGFGTVTSSGITRAHIAAGEGGFLVVNTNTGALQARYLLQPSAAFECAFLGNTGNLFVADGLDGLRSELLTDAGPFSRSLVHNGGAANPTVGDMAHVACGDNFVLTSDRNQVHKFSTANPAAPALAGAYVPSTNSVTDIAASGISGLVLHGGFGNPTRLDLINCAVTPPTLVASQSFTIVSPSSAKRVRAFGDVAFAIDSRNVRLFAFNPNAPTALTPRGVIDITTALSNAQSLFDAAVADNFLYLLDFVGDLFVYDITNPDAPALITHIACRTGATGLAVSGDWMGLVGSFIDAAGNFPDVLDFVNISDRSNPITVNSAMLPGTTTDNIAAIAGPSGPHFATASGLSGVRVFAAPTQWAPAFARQPAAVTTCPGGTAEFSVTPFLPAGDQPRYQWRRVMGDFDQTIVGATGPTLTLTGVAAADAQFAYYAVVTNGCGAVSSRAAPLVMCRVDINCSGAVTVQDIFDFLALFFANNTSADFNGQFGVTVQDLFDFLAAYFAGCV